MLKEFFHHDKDSIKPELIKNIRIGLDISENSTGMVINADGQIFMYLIVPKIPLTLKGQPRTKFTHSAEYLVYNKYPDSENFSENEYNKILSYESIVDVILTKLSEFNISDDCDVFIGAETPSYSSNGRAAINIPQINIMVRSNVLKMFKGYNVSFDSFAPSNLKKLFTGDGRADKPVMVAELTKHINIHVTKNPVHVSDLADAYALTHVTK